MTTALEYFEKRVKEHTESLDVRTKDTGLIWDLWCALQELSKEHDTLRDAYGRLMRGVEEKMQHRQPKLGPLGMGSVEGIKDQSKIYKVWKTMHDSLRALHPELPDLTPIMQGESVPPAPDEWFVWAIDRLREDSKDGNFHRSYVFALGLMTAIDEHGYAIVPKRKG